MLSSQHNDLMRLMMPTFSGTIDDYGKEIQELLPLSFDRINEGQPFLSNFLLSRLPIELLWHIVKLIPKADLANLALVNRDCRQLARSRQFAIIELDYGDKAIGILNALAEEYEARSNNYGRTLAPSIGACIRKITVAAEPRWIASRHEVELSDGFLELDPEVQKNRLDQACGAFFGAYIPKICLVLSNAQVLPHLERLTWADSTAIDDKIFKAIISSNLRYLELQRVSLGEDISLNLPPDSCRWRLESLYLDVVSDNKHNIDTSPLVCSLLCLASPTLKSLTWGSCLEPHSHSLIQSPDLVNGLPSFRRLQELHIDDLTRYDPAWLGILIQPGGLSAIRYLEIDICGNEQVADFFCKCGRLPNLEVFVWSSCGLEMMNPPLAFLQANSHIRKLKIDWAAPNFLEDEVLPLLSARFENLVSLSVRWPEDHDHIPQTALDQISRLQGLEQLCLSSGDQAGWKHSWVIDHVAMQNCVRHLPRLRKLAFSRDTYTEQAEADPERYYEHKTLRNRAHLITLPFFQEGDVGRKLELAWEMQHRNDMTALAARYASTLLELEWIYLGQCAMRIDRSSGIGNPVPLSKERDDCWTFLRRLFG